MQPKKVLYLDVETSGLLGYKHSILTLSAIAEVDGQALEELHLKLKPFPGDVVDTKALEVNGLSMAMLKSPEFEEPEKAFIEKLIPFLSRHINKFDNNDKFILAGYNVEFDLDFLKNYFRKCGNKYFGAFFNYKKVDPLYMMWFLDALDLVRLPNYKLSTVLAHYDIDPGQSHSSQSDIRATRELIILLATRINQAFGGEA